YGTATTHVLSIVPQWYILRPRFKEEKPPMSRVKVHIILGGAAALALCAIMGSVMTTGELVYPGGTAEARVMTAVLAEGGLGQVPGPGPEGTSGLALSQRQVDTAPAGGPRIAQAPSATQPAPGRQAGPPAATPPPLPPPIAFEDALLKAANDLFSKANMEGAP